MRKIPPGSPCSVCVHITDAQQVELQKARTAGHSFTQLAREFPFSRSAIFRHMKAKHNERPVVFNARANYERDLRERTQRR